MGKYIRLVEDDGNMKEFHFLNSQKENIYIREIKEFTVLPKALFGYWINDNIYDAFSTADSLNTVLDVKKGLTTSDNEKFLRIWYEVCIDNVDFNGEVDSGKRWYRTHKGGNYRKWYGNNENVINWENNGEKIKKFAKAVIRNPEYYFKPCVTWTDVATSKTSFRYVEHGSISNASGPSIYGNKENLLYVLGILNTKASNYILKLLCPTIHFEVGQVALFPILEQRKSEVIRLSKENIDIAREDNESFESSWRFKCHPLI